MILLDSGVCLVGKLNFLTHTRPNLAYCVQTLSQFMHSLTSAHMTTLTHVLRYINCTASQGILMKGDNKLTLQAFIDSYWSACPDTRKSISGYVVLFGSSPVSWKSKKQATISKYSSKSEFRVMAHATVEVTWLVRMWDELGVNQLQHVTIHCDNQSALHIARNLVFHKCIEHIDIDCHFTREKGMEGLISSTYLPTSDQLADVFTKFLPSAKFNQLLSKLGMFYPMPSLRGDVKTTYSSSTEALDQSNVVDSSIHKILLLFSSTCIIIC